MLLSCNEFTVIIVWCLVFVSIAETASVRKESKYAALPSDYICQPVTFETLDPLNASALNFLSKVGHRLSS